MSLSRTYGVARNSFQAAATFAGARLSAYAHHMVGPDGEELAVDVAELGPEDADDVVIVVSGCHGVEGYLGSALQREWLEHHAPSRPEGLRVVMIHALNPVGFAWVRRVDETNVDLNRNFIDWSQPPPDNPRYSEIADLLVPASWSDEEQQRTTTELFDIAGRWGLDTMQAVISGGQYEHPTGVFYGGSAPVWSHRWLRTWAAQYLGAVRRATIIDLHTGLGPWGVGELITSVPSSDAVHRRAADIWGDVRSMTDGDSVSAVLEGDWLAAAGELIPTAEVTAVALEYGTVDTVTVLQALRADAWLHSPNGASEPNPHRIREQVRAAFADDDPQWLATCWERFAEVFDAALQR